MQRLHIFQQKYLYVRSSAQPEIWRLLDDLFHQSPTLALPFQHVSVSAALSDLPNPGTVRYQYPFPRRQPSITTQNSHLSLWEYGCLHQNWRGIGSILDQWPSNIGIKVKIPYIIILFTKKSAVSILSWSQSQDANNLSRFHSPEPVDYPQNANSLQKDYARATQNLNPGSNKPKKNG